MTTTIDSPVKPTDPAYWSQRLANMTEQLSIAQVQVELLAQAKKQIMNEAFETGLTLQDLADILGVSKERVSIMLGRRISKQREQVREAIVHALKYTGPKGAPIAEIHAAVTQGLGYDPGRPSIGSYLRTDSKGQFHNFGGGVYGLRKPSVPAGVPDEGAG